MKTVTVSPTSAAAKADCARATMHAAAVPRQAHSRPAAHLALVHSDGKPLPARLSSDEELLTRALARALCLSVAVARACLADDLDLATAPVERRPALQVVR
jgi:hypothetical protein